MNAALAWWGIEEGRFSWSFAVFSQNLAWAQAKPLFFAEAWTLALEFDPSVNAADAHQLVQVITAIDSPIVKGLWDPGNDIYDPAGEVPFPDGKTTTFREILPQLRSEFGPWLQQLECRT